MVKKYQLGRRFHNTKYVCVGAELLMMYAFNFIYQIAFPQVNQFILGVVFAGLAVLFAWGTLKLLNWCAETTWYRVSDEYLTASRGRALRHYKWEDIVFADADNINFISRLPVYLKLKDGTRINLESYIEGIGSLTQDIIAHIEDHAEVTDNLRERLKSAEAISKR